MEHVFMLTTYFIELTLSTFATDKSTPYHIQFRTAVIFMRVRVP